MSSVVLYQIYKPRKAAGLFEHDSKQHYLSALASGLAGSSRTVVLEAVIGNTAAPLYRRPLNSPGRRVPG